MTLGTVTTEYAQCSLCDWRMREKDNHRAMTCHLRDVHKRMMVSSEIRKEMTVYSGPYWPNDMDRGNYG